MRHGDSAVWYAEYLIRNVSLAEAAREVSALLGVEFQARESSYVGEYFRWRERSEVGTTEVDLKLNWFEDGELVHLDMPEGPFVSISAPTDYLFQDRLSGHPNYELYRTGEVRPGAEGEAAGCR